MAERCVALLDLTTHAGVHPRMGVLDVVPLTPIRGAAMETCIALSHEASQDLAALGFQVYLYERSARPGRPCALPAIRGARDLAPDLGPAKRDARIGAVVVGARGPLVAYNIALAEGDVEAARRIAADIRRLRGTDPALRGVRALGLMLATSARAQVSMNITQPDTTGLAGVHAAVRALALQHRAVLGGSEVVGLVPARCLEGADLALLGLNTLRPSQIVESWLVEGPGRPRRDA
jgi:glutamate formiminotransferase